MALFVLSLCPFDISVGVGAFVIGLSQISSFSLDTNTNYDKRTTPIAFQDQGSKVKVTSYPLLLNLVNMIQNEPF